MQRAMMLAAILVLLTGCVAPEPFYPYYHRTTITARSKDGTVEMTEEYFEQLQERPHGWVGKAKPPERMGGLYKTRRHGG
jgi:hypothetical protein